MDVKSFITFGPAQQHPQAARGRFQRRLLLRPRGGPLPRRDPLPIERDAAALPVPTAGRVVKAQNHIKLL